MLTLFCLSPKCFHGRKNCKYCTDIIWFNHAPSQSFKMECSHPLSNHSKKSTSQAKTFLKYAWVRIYMITQQSGSFAVPFLPLHLNKMQDRKGYKSFVSYVYLSGLEDKLLLLNQGGKKIWDANLNMCEKPVTQSDVIHQTYYILETFSFVLSKM